MDSVQSQWCPEYAQDGWRSSLRLLDEAYSERTIRGYTSDFRHFDAWCAENALMAMPASAETVSLYVRAFTEQLKPATIRRRISAISRLHRVCGEADPTQAEIVRLSLRRMHRLRGQRQHQPLGLRIALRNRLLSACGEDLRGLRNRALLRVGYDTLCRRLEIVNLRIEDITPVEGRAGTILVRRSKTDSLGQGRVAFLSPETMEAIRRWTDAAGLKDGPLFRLVRKSHVGPRQLAPYSITRIIKELSRAAGLPAAMVENLSGHSFRIGAALDMVEHGIDLLPIMQAGGWASPTMVMRYTNQVDATKSGAAQLYSVMTCGRKHPHADAAPAA